MSYIRPRPSITNSKSFQIPSASSTENAAVPGAGLQYTLNHSRVSPLETVQPATVHVRDSSSVLLTGEESILKKQQREIELLIVELRDRDRELNEIVKSHRQQLNVWSIDKQRIQALELKCADLEACLVQRNGEVLTMKSNLSQHINQNQQRLSEIKTLKRQQQLNAAQIQKLQLQLANSESQNARSHKVESSLKALLKDKETEIGALSSKLEDTQRMLDTRIEEIKSDEQRLYVQADRLVEQNEKFSSEVVHLKEELVKAREEKTRFFAELTKASDEVVVLKKQLEVAYESEKRKEQLLALQRSKLDRCATELGSLRKVYAHQQRDLSSSSMSHESLSSFQRRSLSTPRSDTGKPKNMT